MKLKWGKEVPKVERDVGIEWSWWSLFIVLIIMIAIFIGKVKGVI